MNISHFLYMNLGKWMTQRTTYITQKGQIYLHKSDIEINRETDLPFLEHKIQNKKMEIISSYMLKSNINKDIKYFFENTQQNSYQILNGDTINIIFNHMNKYNYISIKNISGHLNSIERLWLVNPNLRLGINVIKKHSKCISITFSSDIKII